MKLLPIFARVAAIASIAMAAGCAPTPKQDSTGEYLDDAVITTKVKAAIFNEPTLKSMEINVETFKGRVQLSGFISTQANATTAMNVARAIPGVLNVTDDMRLK